MIGPISFNNKNLLGIQDLSHDEISCILENTATFKDISERDVKKVPTLKGKTVINLFFEPSTRTRTSFEIAGKRLSADVININSSSSSTTKGETLLDTVRTLEAMKPDAIVVRHPCAGAPHFISRHLNSSIINAGDGSHEHPTQALLDLFTIQEQRPKLKGLTAAIVGDISHSRVAMSNILLMRKMGMEVTLIGPPTMIPYGIEKIGVKISFKIDDIIPKADIIIMLRLQMERQIYSLFPSIREYSKYFGLNTDRLKKAKKDLLILHPGPVNRGIEISPEVADGPYSLILNQVTNGLAIRMTILYLLLSRIK